MSTILCLGDSLTEGVDLDKAARWSSLLAHALNVEVTNCGISGDTTAGMLSRFHSEVVTRKPDLVMLLGGSNDLWYNVAPEMIVANFFAMISHARYHGITPLVGMPLPLHIEAAKQQTWFPPVCGYAACNKHIQALGQTLKKIAIESDVPVLDFYQPFLNADGEVAADLFLEDGAHPNAAGHRCMAKIAISLLKEQFLFG